MTEAWVVDVHHFWFDHLRPDDRLSKNDEIDTDIAERFGPLWSAMRDRRAIDFLDDAQTALAAIILFDQFPRNMFRERSDAFATDEMAREIAAGAVKRGFDSGLAEAKRQFLYMPMMHSEAIADQRRSLELFSGLGNENALKFARSHFEVVKRFGRFPHRNEVLGRDSTADEAAAIDAGAVW